MLITQAHKVALYKDIKVMHSGKKIFQACWGLNRIVVHPKLKIHPFNVHHNAEGT